MDRRVKYTKNLIEDTFLSLLEKKDIGSITVTEICEIADINRATFYRYYIDIYDLLKNIQDSFIGEIKESDVVNNISNYSVFSFTKEILNIFINNKKLVKILFDTNNNVYFLNDFLEILYEKVGELWIEEHPSNSEEEIVYAVVYIFNGALGIVNYWIKNNFDKDIDEVSRYIEKLTLDGVHKFIK